MKRSVLIAALAGFATTAAYASSDGNLNGVELRKAVAGKTVYLSANGVVLPIAFRPNGTMSGRLKAFAASFAGGSPVDSGRWWISKNQLCQRWSQWLDGRSYCYKVSRTGQNVVWVRNDGQRGTARIGS